MTTKPRHRCLWKQLDMADHYSINTRYRRCTRKAGHKGKHLWGKWGRWASVRRAVRGRAVKG